MQVKNHQGDDSTKVVKPDPASPTQTQFNQHSQATQDSQAHDTAQPDPQPATTVPKSPDTNQNEQNSKLL